MIFGQEGSTELVEIENFYRDRTNDLAEGWNTTAFEFEDFYLRVGDNNDNVFTPLMFRPNKLNALDSGDGGDEDKLVIYANTPLAYHRGQGIQVGGNADSIKGLHHDKL